MTLSPLLSHVGINVPRYVTVDGQIVLEPHVDSGPAPLQVMTHRFHGGDDPAPDRTTFETAWWQTDPAAFAVDKAAMQLHFPKFQLLEDDGDYAWFGEINTGRGRFSVLVMPQVDRSLPTIKPLRKHLGRQEGKRFRDPPHLYRNGSICVAATTDWDVETHTTATAVAWAAHWFAAYTQWWMSGRWPTVGYGAAA